MPMDFPNMKSLEVCARVHNFREPELDESEDGYRELLAQHVEPIDFIEAQEIRNKVGWDQFTDEQNKDMLRRRGLNF